MVHAAYRLFCREGYLGTTMKAIADEAEVAVQTLYYTFHTKAALLGEALGAAIVSFDQWREPPADPDMAELLPWHRGGRIRVGADIRPTRSTSSSPTAFRTLERVAPLVVAMHGGAGDPDAAAAFRSAEERRLAAYGQVVRAIARKPDGLGSGLNESRATDLLVELYHALATGRGWACPHLTAFFRRVSASQLLS